MRQVAETEQKTAGPPTEVVLSVAPQQEAEPTAEEPEVETRPPPPAYRCEDVFISHHNKPEDNAAADALSQALRRRGLEVWYDRQSLNAGTTFKSEISDALRHARLVVVMFPRDPSHWVIFEASCAYNDHKLLPLMLSDRPVPAPFAGVHAERLPPREDVHAFDRAIGHVADTCHEMIRGRADAGRIERGYIRLCRSINRVFRSGAALAYLVIASLITLVMDLAQGGGPYDSLSHAHLLFGMVALGGLVFIPFSFANALASRSYRERQFGFATSEKLFWIWFVAVLAQPALGLSMTVYAGHLDWHTPWIALSVMIYLLALIFALLGYFQARLAAHADSAHTGRSFIVHRARSLAMFFVSFALMVLIVNLMMFKPQF